MTHARILPLVLIATLLVGSGYGNTADTPPNSSARVGGIDGDEGRYRWAFEQFAAAGLELADVEVRFAADAEPCQGYLGLHYTVDDAHVVDVCDPSVNRRKHTLLHELAHVWVAENIDQETRAEFMELRDLTVWHDGETAWSDRGTEHAAEILAWGIGDHPCWVRPSLNPGDDAEDFAEGLSVLIDAAPRCDDEAPKPDYNRPAKVLA